MVVVSWRRRVEAIGLRGLMALPPTLVRRLAGPPVTIDGLRLDPETQWLLRIKQLLREPAAEAVPIPHGRRVLLRESFLAGGRQPIGRTRDLQLPGPAGPVPARLYVPTAALDASEPQPLLVFLHGGGLIYGDLDSHDASCRVVAERAGVLVLALDYRLAPEHRYPAAVEDCWAGYQWAVEHAGELGADPERVAVGGDSAGGYLSAVVALKAAGAGLPCAHQLLVYPATDFAQESRSRRLFGQGFYLSTEFMDLATDSYLLPDQDRRDPQVSVVHTEKVPDGLAPATVVTAGFDPLRDEGEAYAYLLKDAGVPVDLQRYPGFIHGFFNVVGVGRATRQAVLEIADRLAAALQPREG